MSTTEWAEVLGVSVRRAQVLAPKVPGARAPEPGRRDWLVPRGAKDPRKPRGRPVGWTRQK
jgi:hypothetical protein